MYFTVEQREYLKEIEDSLHSALYSDWCRNVSQSRLENLINIYKLQINKDEKICKNCGKSILNFLKRLAKYYYKDLEEIENKKKENINNQEDGNKGERTDKEQGSVSKAPLNKTRRKRRS